MSSKKLKHAIEYHALTAFTALVRLLPLNVARFIVRRLADLVFYVIPIRRKVVLDNLRKAFAGEKSEKELRRIAHQAYYQFGQTMVELLFFPSFTNDDITAMVRIENLNLLDEALKAGRGAMLVGAHFGNWELMGAALAVHHPVTFVVGQQQNHKVDDLLNSYRIGKGIKIIPLKMALRGVLKTLKANELVAILADQDAHEDGAFVPYFGRPASTPKGPALFALRAGCPMIMGYIVRTSEGFTASFELVPPPVNPKNEDDAVRQYTANHVAILERITREHPDHWFWMHRRWKTKPVTA